MHSLMKVDAEELRAAFAAAKQKAREGAVWDLDDPGLPPETCAYCGQYRQARAGCVLDGHAACVVTNDFKQRVAEVLESSPLMTYATVAEMLGVGPGTITSWRSSVVGNHGVRVPAKHERALPRSCTKSQPVTTHAITDRRKTSEASGSAAQIAPQRERRGPKLRSRPR